MDSVLSQRTVAIDCWLFGLGSSVPPEVRRRKVRTSDIYWYEAYGIGKRKMKIRKKRLLG